MPPLANGSASLSACRISTSSNLRTSKNNIYQGFFEKDGATLLHIGREVVLEEYRKDLIRKCWNNKNGKLTKFLQLLIL